MSQVLNPHGLFLFRDTRFSAESLPSNECACGGLKERVSGVMVSL